MTFPNHRDTLKESYDPVKKQGGGVTLRIYKDSMNYELSVFLSTKCMGTTTITAGDNVITEPYEWSISIIKEFEGQTDGKVITGSWTGPACRYSNVTECIIPFLSLPNFHSWLLSTMLAKIKSIRSGRLINEFNLGRLFA